MIEAAAAQRLFVDGHTAGEAWQDRAVEEATIRRLYELVRLAPTAFNCSPGRFVFVRSPAARSRLVDIVARGNRIKVERAPVTVILGYDLDFFEALPRLFPKYDASAMFRDDPALAERTAFHSSTLQAAYLIIAARSMGLDAAPLSGFDKARLEAEFFTSGRVQVNLLCCLGYGAPDVERRRGPRLDFEEACRLL